MGLEARVSGCSSHLSLCKHTQAAHARRRPQSSIHTRIHAHGLRGSETHANTRAHTRPCTGTLRHTTAGPLGTRRPTCGPTPPAPCIVSEYCQRLGQRGRQSHLPPNGPSPLCFPTRVKPQGSPAALGQRSWVSMKEGQTPGPWGRVVWVTGWGPAPPLCCHPARGRRTWGGGREGQTGGGEGARTTAEEPHLYSTAV